MNLITTTPALEQLCQRLWDAAFITVDTEFLREKTYYAQLCLIQVADDDGAAAIDPLADGLDLAPFLKLLNEAPCIKVFHAARQDLEIFFHLSGRLPHPLFDTQIAAMVCGFGENAGYETLVGKLTGGKLDKSMRFSDWSRRPLNERQIAYALDDVIFLRDIYRHFSQQLDENARHSWLDEDIRRLEDPATYRIEPSEAWRRVKIRGGSRRFLARLQAVAAWREEEAQRRDLPRAWVMKDEAMQEIAAHPPKTVADLDRVRGVSGGFSKGAPARSLMDALAAAEMLPSDQCPRLEERHAPAESAAALTELLKVLLKARALEHGVAPRLIAQSSEIDAFIAGDPAGDALTHGWRRELFGAEAEALKAGRVALAIRDGRVAVVPLPSSGLGMH